MRICAIEQVDGLITDTEADDAVVAQFRDHGIDVQLV